LEGNTIVIRLARNLSAREEQRHIENLLGRMVKLAVRETRRTVIDPFRPLLTGSTDLRLQLSAGRELRFTLQPGVRTKARKTADGWTVDVGPRTHRTTLHRFLWRLLSLHERAWMEAVVRQINAETLRVPIRRVRVSFAVSQWGSCSAQGVIMINASLLFLPPDLLRYVVVHELAHRLVQNHSRSFWKVVEGHQPDYQEARKKLRNFRMTTL